jgi:hypothetical protein
VIFASDVDRTLIHPLDELALCGEPAPAVRVMEVYKGRAVSCASERGLSLLAEVARRAAFVPVTTRSREQYARLEAIPELARLAVTTNGAVILRDGVADPDWTREVDARLADSAPTAWAEERLLAAAGDWLLRHRDCEARFLYGIVERDAVPAGAVEALDEELRPAGWEAVLHGRKLYLLPLALTKWAAVERVVAELGPEAGPLATAGDSLLDACLFDGPGVSVAFCPARGELAVRRSSLPLMRLTSAHHVLGTEEMLEDVLALAGAPAGAR